MVTSGNIWMGGYCGQKKGTQGGAQIGRHLRIPLITRGSKGVRFSPGSTERNVENKPVSPVFSGFFCLHRKRYRRFQAILNLQYYNECLWYFMLGVVPIQVLGIERSGPSKWEYSTPLRTSGLNCLIELMATVWSPRYLEPKIGS